MVMGEGRRGRPSTSKEMPFERGLKESAECGRAVPQTEPRARARWAPSARNT